MILFEAPTYCNVNDTVNWICCRFSMIQKPMEIKSNYTARFLTSAGNTPKMITVLNAQMLLLLLLLLFAHPFLQRSSWLWYQENACMRLVCAEVTNQSKPNGHMPPSFSAGVLHRVTLGWSWTKMVKQLITRGTWLDGHNRILQNITR